MMLVILFKIYDRIEDLTRHDVEQIEKEEKDNNFAVDSNLLHSFMIAYNFYFLLIHF